MAETDLKMYWFRLSGFQVQDVKYVRHLGQNQFSFPFPSLPLDYFDVQDLKMLLGIISFEIAAASSQQYSLRCNFCRMLDRI